MGCPQSRRRRVLSAPVVTLGFSSAEPGSRAVGGGGGGARRVAGLGRPSRSTARHPRAEAGRVHAFHGDDRLLTP